MARTPNLELRGRVWWVYKTVPPSLRTIIGKRNLRQSLKTSDLEEALRRRPSAVAALTEQIDLARAKANGTLDVVEQTAKAWRTFLNDPRNSDGQPLDANVTGQFISEEMMNIGQQYGPEAAERFQAIVAVDNYQRLDAYFGEFQKQAEVTAKTRFEQKTALKRLMAWDPTLSLHSLDRKTASRYCAEGLAFTDSPATKNKQITCLSSYWRWMLRKGYVEQNPWREQSFSVKGRARQAMTAPERPFTDAELRVLLDGPADQRLADTMRIAALSGMRLDEICMLRATDCRDGMFFITKSKTQAGVRRVPIHPDLLAIIERRLVGKRPDQFLIHELGPAPAANSVRPRSDPLGKQFARYRKELKIDAHAKGQRRSQVNFHSFRRWFITKAEQAGQPPWIIEAVVGHARTGQSLSVYSAGPSFDQRRVCVESVQLPVSMMLEVR